MLFSSLVFIWYFLPIVFFAYMCIPGIRAKNLLLLAASILFYAWGEPKFVLLMLLSIGINYIFGMLLDYETKKRHRQLLMALCLLINLGLLGYYKYFNFLAELVNDLAGREILGAREIVLPIGISFYTFQALSYVVDVYRRTIRVQKNPLDLALYISFFPQLIAGPIVKYYEIDAQLKRRSITAQRMACGIKRFSYGLGKKVIFANTFAAVVDNVLTFPNESLAGPGLAWFTILLYTLQIYYDFSGYSDMAIGLGKMFGFDFMENFNYPYMSQSIREFWRRWHISLSTWFKEYLYIPLGGNRKGRVRTYINLFIVFLVTGLWHGAGKNFVLWGAYYGVFIVAERMFLGRLLEKIPVKLLNHMYTMLVVVVGWMLFRIEDMDKIHAFARIMFFRQPGVFTIPMFADRRVLFFFAAGILLAGPLQFWCRPLKVHLYDEERVCWYDIAVMAVLLIFCTMLLVNNTYNPFIYFRF